MSLPKLPQDEPAELGPVPTLEESNRAMRAGEKYRAARKSYAQQLWGIRRWCKAHGIRLKREEWRDLLLSLLQPQRRKTSKMGRRLKWRALEWALLAGDVLRECPHKSLDAQLDVDTARKLAGREPWKSFLRRGTWGPQTRGTHGPAEALIKAYSNIPRQWRAYGRVLYRHPPEKNGEVVRWESLLKSVGHSDDELPAEPLQKKVDPDIFRRSSG